MAVIARDQITLSWQLDIKQTIYYYKKQSSTSAAPAKPTSYPPSGWSTTEPAYSTGETSTLYVTVCTIFSDNTYEYSDVTVSSSFEAAKAAYNKAAAAEGAANNAMTAANGKNKIFYQNAAPASGMSEGDLWFDTDGGNAIHEYKKTSSNPDTYAWVLRQFGNGSLAAGSVTASEINVNNLAAISAYLGGAVIGGLNNTNGVLTVKDASGNTIGTWNKDGINAIAGTIGGFTISGIQLRSDVTVSGVTYSAVTQSMGTSTDTARGAFYIVRNENGTITNPFLVQYNGKLTAKDANITGTITANGGSIGGFDISATQLRSDITASGTTYSAVINKGTALDDFAFYTVTNSGTATNPFYVRYDGYMRATNANITGTITASSGSIGGFDISDYQLRSDKTVSGITYSAVMQSMGNSTDTTRAAFYIAKNNNGTVTNPFIVRYNGDLISTSGNIGGFDISDTKLRSDVTVGVTKYSAVIQKGSSDSTYAFYTATKVGDAAATNPFYVRYDGYMKATNANITGTITAKSGTIGGWNIEDYAFAKKTGDAVGSYRMRFQAPDTPTTSNYVMRFDRLDSGTWTSSSATITNLFRLTYGGALYAQGANIAGTITSGSGSSIGGWTATTNALYRGSSTYGSATTGDAYIGVNGISFGGKNIILRSSEQYGAVSYLARNASYGIEIGTFSGSSGRVGITYHDYTASQSGSGIEIIGDVYIRGGTGGLTVDNGIESFGNIGVDYGNIYVAEGNIEVSNSTASEARVKVQNNLHNGNLTVSSAGLFCLYSVTNQHILIQDDTNGVVKVRCSNGMYRPVGTVDTDGNRVGAITSTSATAVRVYGQKGTAGAGYSGYTLLTGTSGSDIRLKRNIKPVEVNALPLINSIEIKSFDWIPGQRDYTHQPIGMIADQIEKLDSRLVIGGGYDPDGTPNYKVIDDHYLICYLTKAVQELSAKIKELERMKAA